MQSTSKQNDLLFTIEEKTIQHAESIINDENYKENNLVKEYTKLYKRYKKLYKQLKSLISMTDKQQKQVNNLNNELVQTNKLLAGLGGKKSLTVNSALVKQMSSYASQLILAKNHLWSVCQKDQKKDYQGLLQNLNIVTTNLQDCIFQTKMQPLAIVYAGLPKIISQTTKLNQKEIQLNLKGKDVKVDNDFLESLSFILTHLIKNACEHGLETKQERLKLNKSSVGTIDIKAYKQDRHIIIEVNDDGRGMNFQSFKEKNSVSNNPKIELKQWIEFLKEADDNIHVDSGLSKISQKVEDIKGSIHVQSKDNQGLRFYLKFPESIAIISGMIVEVSRKRFIIPQSSIVELLSIYDLDIFTQIQFTHEHEVIRLRDKLIPMIRLDEVLNHRDPFTYEIRTQIAQKYSQMRSKEYPANIDDTLIFVILKADNERFALIVDQIIGNEEIVYMPLHPLVRNISIYNGLSILGDGSVSLILDPEGIFKHVDIHIDNPEKRTALTQKNSKIQRILLFKSGIKEQFSVLLSEVGRIVRINKDDIQYKSDIPLVAIDGAVIQVIILDHFLSVSELAFNDILYLLILKNVDRSLGVLVSTLGGIHNVELFIETDTFVEKGALGTMKYNDKITIFLDVQNLAARARMAYMNIQEEMNDNHS